MKLIECKLGPAEPMVGSTTYKFQRDRFGRFVARVLNDDHAAIMLAVEHYREVPEEPAAAADAQDAGAAPAAAPKKPRGRKPAPPVEPAAAADAQDAGQSEEPGPAAE